MHETLANLIVNPIEVGIGFLITMFLGFFVKPLLDAIGNDVEILRPKRVDEDTWESLVKVPAYLGGLWVGILERIFFFAAIIGGAPTLVLAWLGFKVASKWESWSNVYKIPDRFPGATEMESLVARTRWGARTFQRFLVGTLYNLISAIIGVAVFEVLVEYWSCS